MSVCCLYVWSGINTNNLRKTSLVFSASLHFYLSVCPAETLSDCLFVCLFANRQICLIVCWSSINSNDRETPTDSSQASGGSELSVKLVGSLTLCLCLCICLLSLSFLSSAYNIWNTHRLLRLFGKAGGSPELSVKLVSSRHRVLRLRLQRLHLLLDRVHRGQGVWQNRVSECLAAGKNIVWFQLIQDLRDDW